MEANIMLMKKSMEAQNTLREQKEKQNVSLSPQDNPEQEIGINQQEESKDETKEGDNEMHQEEEINTQSKMNEGDSERNQEPTETQLHGLFRETDHLLGLMMGLELSEMALRLSLERAMAHSNMSRQDLRIVLLGLLGSGKSSTGNTILNRDAFRAGLMTTTRSCEKQEAVVFGRTISIIDTPAIILNGSLLMAHQRCEIEKSLEMSVPGPHVFLLMINLLEFTEEEKNTVKWIQENFEKDALNHTIALFTHDDLLIDESLNEYLKKSNDLKSLIDSCGGRYHSFNNKAIQNRFQVIKLLVKIDEMMERNGGNHYTKHNIFKSAQNKNQSNTNQDDGCVIL